MNFPLAEPSIFYRKCSELLGSNSFERKEEKEADERKESRIKLWVQTEWQAQVLHWIHWDKVYASSDVL